MFHFEPDHAVTSLESLRDRAETRELLKAGTAGRHASDFSNQFCVFQFGSEQDGPTLVDPSFDFSVA